MGCSRDVMLPYALNGKHPNLTSTVTIVTVDLKSRPKFETLYDRVQLHWIDWSQNILVKYAFIRDLIDLYFDTCDLRKMVKVT